MHRRTLVPLASIAAVALGLLGVGVLAARPADAAALTTNWYASAPYLMPFDNSPPDPVAVMNATGQKAFQLAFILAPNGGGCTPTWDGTLAVSSDTDASTSSTGSGPAAATSAYPSVAMAAPSSARPAPPRLMPRPPTSRW